MASAAKKSGGCHHARDANRVHISDRLWRRPGLGRRCFRARRRWRSGGRVRLRPVDSISLCPARHRCGSGKQVCLFHLSDARFKSRRADDGDLAVLELIADPSVPTTMVEKREMFNGLKYPDHRCWKFFSSVEYVYSTVVTADNFVACEGSVLREISESLLSNKNLNKNFADLCDASAKSFSPSDTSTCLHFFLLVFGRVRAKDLALKYRSNLYKSKDVTSFRSGIAARTGKKGKRKNHKKIRHDEIMESLEELDEEIDNTTKRSSSVIDDEE